MKSVKIIALLLLLCSGLNAQKIAHLDYDSLLRMMPETKLATDAANAYLASLDAELTAMQTELQKKAQTYESDNTAGEFLKASRLKELEQLQKRMEEFQTQARQDYSRRQAELTTPIMEKATAAIKLVAKELGYKYVLDNTKRSTFVLYSEESDNILMQVKKKLDSMPLAKLPIGAGTAR